MSTFKTVDLQATERSFLFAFIALRLLLFARTFGMFLGYDVRGHLGVISSISWAHPFLPLHLSYYSWHPPLGFLLAHTITLLDISPLLSAQILSFVASLIAFFFMRLTLKSLGLLSRLSGIVFLYIGASIPMQVYLSVIVSLDVFVFCFMSIVLFLSIQLLWKRQNLMNSLFYGVALVVTLSLAILSKQSGFLLLSLPCLAFAFAKSFRTPKNFFVAASLIAISFFVGIAYLYVRYYLPEHRFFFNSAGTFIWVREYTDAVLWRDSNLTTFLLSYVLPISGGPRLFATWASYWLMYDAVPASVVGEFFGLFFCAFGVFPLLIGFVALMRNTTNEVWSRFGYLIVVFSFLQLLGLFYYIYSLPILGFISNKGIYIASSSWGIAYCFAAAIPFVLSYKYPFQKMALTNVEVEHTALFLTAGFMIVNQLFPALGGPSAIF